MFLTNFVDGKIGEGGDVTEKERKKAKLAKLSRS